MAALARAMSASAAAKSFHATGPEQAGRCWNGEANWLSSCRKLGKFRLAGAARRRRLALEAGQAVDDMHGVVGAALLAVVDRRRCRRPSAASTTLGDGLARRRRRARRGSAAALLLRAAAAPPPSAGRGRLPVWVVRIRVVLRRIASPSRALSRSYGFAASCPSGKVMAVATDAKSDREFIAIRPARCCGMSTRAASRPSRSTAPRSTTPTTAS